MTMDNQGPGQTRRAVLRCMAWGSAGLLWTVAGGVPRARALDDIGAKTLSDAGGFSFVQISDSHIGFVKDPNPMPDATLREALARIAALKRRPAFLLHTGDVSHLSKPAEFDAAGDIMKTARLETFYVPGEHDVINDDGAAFFARFGRNPKSGGWYSFDQGGVHFIGLVNVVNLKAGGLGYLGPDQLRWLEADLKDRSASTPIVVFAHMPLWALYPGWGWGTDDAAEALGYLKRFGSVTVLNGHIHQIQQKVEGTISFHTARSTAYPQPAPGQGPGPGPMQVAADKLRSVLGIRQIDFVGGKPALADSVLAG
ncbi:MAG TPA: metallophosphoesterase [Stellaceae bacterium]|nr:metallophosphoesterase [Stellaceae bacterium]